jgi:uncharacterized protein (TIGR00369 family)
MQSEDEVHWQRVIVEENPAFARFMGVHITSGSRDRIEAELTVGEELANRNGVLHGGAIITCADILGGAASVLNLQDGARTTTIESKTNFFRALPLGETARAVCIPLHRGHTHDGVADDGRESRWQAGRHRHPNAARNGTLRGSLAWISHAACGLGPLNG